MKKIMIVDDNEDVRYTLKRFLGSIEGYIITEADGGKQCLNLLKKGQIPDLILLDIMMPNMDGWETVAKMKSNPKWKSIPVIFLTAKKDDKSKKMGDFASMDYIEKPFDNADLKKRIEAFFNRIR